MVKFSFSILSDIFCNIFLTIYLEPFTPLILYKLSLVNSNLLLSTFSLFGKAKFINILFDFTNLLLLFSCFTLLLFS
jgi:hypothetical protein